MSNARQLIIDYNDPLYRKGLEVGLSCGLVVQESLDPGDGTLSGPFIYGYIEVPIESVDI